MGHWNLDEDIYSLTADSQRTAWIHVGGTTDNTNGEEEKIVMKIALLQQRMMAKKMWLLKNMRMTKKEESSHVAYEEFQGCLSDFGDVSLTEQEVQDCMESSYSGIDSNEDTPAESTNDGGRRRECV